MNQTFEETKYYCSKCTARKQAGWIHCPFCGIQGHYYVDPSTLERVTGSGIVRLHQSTVAEQCVQGEAISSEEDHFNSAIKTVRETFDKLKRVRKSRDRAEAELKTAIATVHELTSRVHLLQQEIGRSRTPQPMAIRNVYGQLPDSPTREVLGILRIEQSYPVCDITVRLPR